MQASSTLIETLLLTALSVITPPSQHQSMTSSLLEFHVAPMQCFTNQPLRILLDKLSPSSIKWTEMEKVEDLLPDVDQALAKRLGAADDKDEESFEKLVLQLGSNDPVKLKECSRVALNNYESLREINLNCGCPAIASGGAPTYGASLMTQPKLTSELVASIAELGVPVSVKTRIAVFEQAEDLRPLDDVDRQYLKEYLSGIVAAGASHVILHARPAVLAGLSPVKNRIVPSLDYSLCEEMAKELPGYQVTLNGGITSLDQLKLLHERHVHDNECISSYMAGRWILKRPLDLVQVENFLIGQRDVSSQVNFRNIQESLTSYIDYCMKHSCRQGGQRAPRFSSSDLMLPLFLVVEQLREDYDDNDDDTKLALSFGEMEELYDMLLEGMEEVSRGKISPPGNSACNFKKLSTSFKGLVGTKVVNKWKRNRGEL